LWYWIVVKVVQIVLRVEGDLLTRLQKFRGVRYLNLDSGVTLSLATLDFATCGAE